MRRRIPMILAALALLLCTAIVSAQAPPAPPKPGPEVKAMGAMVGAWSTSVDIKPNPDMPKGGKVTSLRVCAWAAGGFGVSCTDSGNFQTKQATVLVRNNHASLVIKGHGYP